MPLSVFVWQQPLKQTTPLCDVFQPLASHYLREMLARILLVIATILLFHAAYSAYEHLSHLKALGRPEGYLPFNTVYESIFALILGTLGASLNAPPLKDITWASEMKKRTIDEMDSRLGFANYHSRGKSFLVPLPSEKP